MKLTILRPFRHGNFKLKALALLCLLGISWVWTSTSTSTSLMHHVGFRSPAVSRITEDEMQQNTLVARQFINVPVREDEFREMGKRIQTLTRWLMQIDMKANPSNTEAFSEYRSLVEQTILSLFPFIHRGNEGGSHENSTSFTQLRKSFIPGSRGIVIPTGIETFRYACHLILNIRLVVRSKLPIEIAYAGDADLPPPYRSAFRFLFSLFALPSVEFLDVSKVLNDTTLRLSDGTSKFAIKPFALLASRFEEGILADADAVFLQAPEVILDAHSGYLRTGTLFFHDRLVGKGTSDNHQKFWRLQMKGHTPSATFNESRAMRGNYGHEQESGVVVVNKGKLSVLMGLMHACWQNTYKVRELVTYRNTYGDKETYWMGMELSGVEYAFAKHYGGIIGEVGFGAGNETVGPMKLVCGSVIAHVDEGERLLWFNGGLVRSKISFEGKQAFMDVKGESVGLWVLDGQWWWNIVNDGDTFGGDNWDVACMEGGTVKSMSLEESGIIERSVEKARVVDAIFAELMELPTPRTIQDGGVDETYSGDSVRLERKA
ncbi:hypothetical protein DSL72_001888 [Monilinia vaccinii-corymbosi]|uniref:Glycosyltransferase family 71 protein n=1 Tax=Monilinia vaccinii-corymbosi TaxID=61207 RepID=A0A8A3PB49_9HELO|nr:hypothetical protein DSL72_001888 [Monilinia vaccinii-corymbosi]